MSTTKLSRKQVQQYISVADEKSLRIVQAILDIEQDEDWRDTMPVEVQKSVEHAIKESDEGECIPHDDVKKMYQKWLKK
jgi:predicted transcriptional regulator